MFRTKATRRTKRAVSPLRAATNEPTQQESVPAQPPTNEHETNSTLEKNMTNFFEAESAAVALTKPWLRLERGLRLQKYRMYAETYPGLSNDEKDALYKMLVKANDAKLLNTKQQIQYENGKIVSVKGLKVIRTGDLEAPAVFKIETVRPTKRNSDV